MKIAITIARVLLGLIFVVFGLNGFFNFIPVPEMPEKATEFMMLLHGSGWLSVVKLLEIVGGLCLLAGRFVPLGLTILGPIIVNILLFHILLEQSGLPVAIICTLLEVFLIWAYRPAFMSVFAADAQPVSS